MKTLSDGVCDLLYLEFLSLCHSVSINCNLFGSWHTDAFDSEASLFPPFTRKYAGME